MPFSCDRFGVVGRRETRRVRRGYAGAMVIRGEPDPISASLEEWVNYREHLRALPEKDKSVSVAIAVANAQIQKLQQTGESKLTA